MLKVSARYQTAPSQAATTCDAGTMAAVVVSNSVITPRVSV
jgi:hypothetical protein